MIRWQRFTLLILIGCSLTMPVLPGLGQATNTLTLTWDASVGRNLVGYRVYYGVASQTYTNRLDLGNVTNVTISGLVSGVTYYFAATAFDAKGSESIFSNQISYTVPNNGASPKVTLTSPSSGAAHSAPAVINLAATVVANGHTISSVQFYNGSTLLGQDTSPAYSLVWNNVAAGNPSLSAIAIYDAGSRATSAVVHVVVTNPPPVVALTSPANGAVFTTPAIITLTAAVTTNGHSISQVQFYNGGVLLGSDSTPPYSFTWNNVGTGSYAVRAAVGFEGGGLVYSSTINIIVAALPAPWLTADIGNVGLAGSTKASSTAFTVTGAGNLSGLADNFRFVYQPGSISSSIQAQFSSVQNTGPNACIGVMIRETLTAGSEYALMGIAPDGTFRFQSRSSTGGITSTTTGSASPAPNAWGLVMRSGTSFYGFTSVDGVNWTFLDSATFTMANNAYIGLAVASGSTSVLNTSVFTNLTVQP
jgi:hypothetical protein